MRGRERQSGKLFSYVNQDSASIDSVINRKINDAEHLPRAH
jgi:hypothetical protein